MAGASAKKTAKNAAVKSTYYSGVAIAATAINFVVTIGLLPGGSSLSSLAWCGFLGVVALLSFRMIRSALELGVGYDLWQDLFVINAVVQVGSLWSSYVWLLYLAVPGYAFYVFGGKLLSYIFTPQATDADPSGKKDKVKQRRY